MRLHPIEGQDRVVLLKPLITSPLIEVGAYSYYDDPEHALEFQTRNVTHHYGPDRLIIGSFCAIAAGGDIHHERRKPPDERPLDLSISDHGSPVGRAHRSDHRPTVPR